MSATLIGKTPKWGITDDEVGLIVVSLDFDYQAKEKESLDRNGEVQGLVMYGETVACSLKAEVPADTTPPQFTGKLAGTLSIANDIADHTQTALTTARNVIKNIKRSLAREDFETIDISSTIYPLISAT